MKRGSDLVTIVTPSYNRCDKLKRLYKSLLKQTNNNYKWLVIDDGSTDKTKDLIETFRKQNRIHIDYVYKENGGKHTALNLAFKTVDTYFTFIVDSDDVLTEDAIESIYRYYPIVRKHNLSGIAFLRGYSRTKCIGDRFPINQGIANDNDIHYKKMVGGDKAEVWRTDVLSQYQFPVFRNEKFQGENFVWTQIAFDYDMFYVNKIIYLTQYLDGGLTKSGRGMRLRNPLGGMENSKVSLDSRLPLWAQIKAALLFDVYGFCAGYKLRKIETLSGKPVITGICGFPSLLLYSYWKRRYL